jgi:hypothetical protein
MVLFQAYAQEFNVLSAVRELLTYAVKYNGFISQVLANDALAQRHRLGERLDNVMFSMGTTSNGHCSIDAEHIYATVT